MFRPRIETLEDRKLFSVTDLVMDPFNANVLDNNGATDDMSLSVVDPGVPPAGYVRRLPVMEEEGIYPFFAQTYGPRAPVAYAAKLQDCLVSSFTARHVVSGGSVGPSGLEAPAVDRAMADLGDHQADAVLIGLLLP
jgi:hypothetical protein